MLGGWRGPRTDGEISGVAVTDVLAAFTKFELLVDFSFKTDILNVNSCH